MRYNLSVSDEVASNLERDAAQLGMPILDYMRSILEQFRGGRLPISNDLMIVELKKLSGKQYTVVENDKTRSFFIVARHTRQYFTKVESCIEIPSFMEYFLVDEDPSLATKTFQKRGGSFVAIRLNPKECVLFWIENGVNANDLAEDTLRGQYRVGIISDENLASFFEVSKF